LGLEAKTVDNLGDDVTARCKEVVRTCGSEVDGAGVPAVSWVSMKRMATESDGIVGALFKKVHVAPEVRETTHTM
jgi:hypothetical protein